jgi:hypothetical protein
MNIASKRRIGGGELVSKLGLQNRFFKLSVHFFVLVHLFFKDFAQ